MLSPNPNSQISATLLERRVERLETALHELKEEQRNVLENQRIADKKVETLLNMLRDKERSSGSQIHHHPQGKNARAVAMDTDQGAIAGPSTRKRKIGEVVQDATTASAGPSSRRLQKRPRRPSPVDAQAGGDSELDEKDELESDSYVKPEMEERSVKRKRVYTKNRNNREDIDRQNVLIFRNDERCIRCINSIGRSECMVQKEPYQLLPSYVDRVLAGSEEHRPKGSSCFFCMKQNATFCNFPMTREKLGPGFTHAHIAGPFPVAKTKKPKAGKAKAPAAQSLRLKKERSPSDKPRLS